jgi:tetratricopeptide (TPR) repeat protein
LLGLPRERGLGVQAGIFPEEALAALDPRGPGGRLFHDLDFGGYIEWRDPARKTFLDGRLEVAGPERLAQFIDAHESETAWDQLVSRWDFDALLLEHSSRGSAALLRHVLESGAWTPVCFSPEAVLLLARSRADRPAPEVRPPPGAWTKWLRETRGPAPGAGTALASLTHRLDRALRETPSPSAVRRAVRYANLAMTLGRIDVAREGYEAVLARQRNDPEALFNLGLCAMHEGNAAEARRIWQDALPRVDAGSRALFRRALEASTS